MILLTRLDKSAVLVNFDTIKYIEATPDSLVSFVNGDSLIVLEPLDEIDRRVIQYKARLLSLAKIDPSP